jgi:hypothetical protein
MDIYTWIVNNSWTRLALTDWHGDCITHLGQEGNGEGYGRMSMASSAEILAIDAGRFLRVWAELLRTPLPSESRVALNYFSRRRRSLEKQLERCCFLARDAV